MSKLFFAIAVAVAASTAAVQAQETVTVTQPAPSVQVVPAVPAPNAGARIEVAAPAAASIDVETRAAPVPAKAVDLGIRFGAVTQSGLRIDAIEPGSMFVNSDLRRGDIVFSVNGLLVGTDADFAALVRSRPGVRIPIRVLRHGVEHTVYVTYRGPAVRPQPVVVVRQPPVLEAPGFLGVTFDSDVPDAAVVYSVVPASPAARTGLRAGDDIVALNGEAITSYRQAVDRIDQMRAGEPLVIIYTRRVQNKAETVLAPQPGSEVRAANRPVEIRVSEATPPAPADRPVEVQIAPAVPPVAR